MAFCNSCGATLAPGTQFCNKCGAAIAGGVPTATPTPAAPPATGGSGALKVVLIVIAVIVGIGVLGVATVGIVGYHFMKSSHVKQEGDHVKVETPFGNVESNANPEQAAKDVGIETYPGAEMQKNGTASASFGPMHTASAAFTTSDSVDKVCGFYKSKLTNPTVTSSDNNRCTYISNDKDKKSMITVNVDSSGDTTRIQITNVSKVEK
ncbi:MAG TPA: zinc ribbon domain-containing protein [Candidatus Solibacter sp.]|nr:zinc ribbon domain-containing protein [Candidatus Solibacter sp.]